MIKQIDAQNNLSFSPHPALPGQGSECLRTHPDDCADGLTIQIGGTNVTFLEEGVFRAEIYWCKCLEK